VQSRGGRKWWRSSGAERHLFSFFTLMASPIADNDYLFCFSLPTISLLKLGSLTIGKGSGKYAGRNNCFFLFSLLSNRYILSNCKNFNKSNKN
jgi:hypothetical protein